MPRRFSLFLFLLGLALPLFIAQFQPFPGYLDADYYFAGGIQLATGKGFSEPYLWNYLDGTTSLPHPSHSYWMPLASIIAALGMWLTGEVSYASGRLFFLLIAALIPPLTANLAYHVSARKDLALSSGVLAVFCVYNAPFVGVTDNFSVFMVLGVLYFLVLTRILDIQAAHREKNTLLQWVLLGILSGLLNLARSDGLLWLGVTFLFALSPLMKSIPSRSFSLVVRNLLLALFGFLLVMSPWYLRNLQIYGALMSPGGSRVLWLQNYDQTFTYPPSELTLTSFLEQGWAKILTVRISALGINLLNGFAAHGGIILSPFIILGIIYRRRDIRVQLAVIAWLILLLVMSFIFPFAGARGAFFHAGAALQPWWWVLAPLGLETFLASFPKNGFGSEKSRFIFRNALVLTTVLLTAYVVHYRFAVMGWGEGEDRYPAVEEFLQQQGILPADLVIVGNAPGYYLSTGRAAISIPYGGEEAIRAVSKQFGAPYVIFENKNSNSTTKPNSFYYLGEANGARIYKIEP